MHLTNGSRVSFSPPFPNEVHRVIVVHICSLLSEAVDPEEHLMATSGGVGALELARQLMASSIGELTR